MYVIVLHNFLSYVNNRFYFELFVKLVIAFIYSFIMIVFLW